MGIMNSRKSKQEIRNAMVFCTVSSGSLSMLSFPCLEMDIDERNCKELEESTSEGEWSPRQSWPQIIRITKYGQDSNNWDKCSYTHTSRKSLAHLFYTSFSLAEEGKFVDISLLVLEFIGSCHCKGGSKIGYRFPEGEFCKYPYCTCSNVALVCNVCSIKGIKYCSTCDARYVKRHLCRSS